METNKFIKMDNLQDIKRLASIVSSINGEVIVTKGLLKINAKSVLGLLSLDLSHGAKITYPYNEQLDNFLQPFEF
jgi:hypothetical protein